MSEKKGLLAELKRRKVIHTAAIYTAFAWVAIQIVTTVLPLYGGDAAPRIIVAVILLGLPVAIIVSWLFDYTPQGFKRDIDPGAIRVEAPARASAEPFISKLPPAPATSLIGRETEIDAIAAMLGSGVRAVSITGPGGTGKTRVAIAVADRLRGAYPDGVAYIELAAVTEADDVVPAMAAALGVKEAETRTLAQGLATLIADGRVLLVLDNLEQVIDAAPALADLLRDCPALHLLATSRAPLRISAEVEYPLRPLALPPEGSSTADEDLETYAAVQLFVDRTVRARPGFRITRDNADAILRICRRLDGLPLALELAAARLRTLEPDVLLERLSHALDVLTAGARDLPARQRTLRATIDWSHSLLNETEQVLFRRLAVFAGGWTQHAVAGVCADAGVDVLDTFESLVEKGLVRSADNTGRFLMLETIREYAVEKLVASAEESAMRRRHAEYFMRFASDRYAEFTGTAQITSLQRNDEEAANIAEALHCFRDLGAAGDSEAVRCGLQLCGSLWMQWHTRGLHLKAHEWSGAFLALPWQPAHADARAFALLTASVASMTVGNVARAYSEIDEAETLTKQNDGDGWALHAVCYGVASLTAGSFDQARHWLDEAVSRARRDQRPWELGCALSFLGIVEVISGNVAEARARFDEAMPIHRALGDRQGLGSSLGGLAGLAAAEGKVETALALYQESFDAYHEIGDRPEEARVLDAMAWLRLDDGRVTAARDLFISSLHAYEEVGSVRGVGIALVGLAATHAAEGRPAQAIRIAAAATVLSETEGVANDYTKHGTAPRYLDPARALLDSALIEQMEAEGRALSVRDAVRAALDSAASEPGARILQPA